jgi:hypothetical protein
MRLLGRPRAGSLSRIRPIYGPLIHPYPLAHGPMNELGFVVTWIRMEFPDCEAMTLVGTNGNGSGLFEYESRNFLRHMHDAKQCDLIMCWKHNWPECPVEVLELRKVLQDRMMA